MVDAVQDVTASEEAGAEGMEVETEVTEIMKEVLDHVLLWNDPSTTEVDFYSLDYRKAPSMASASSASGSEFGDLSDSELPFVESDDDSDREFEKLQALSCELRLKTFKEEHPDDVLKQKRVNVEKIIDKSNLEHDYDNLPPLENLTIHCEESIPLEPVGHVTSIVDCLVVIQSDSGVALDFDSVLFDKDRNSVGVVYDLFGPVRSPFYSVRFNTKEEAAAKMNVGMQVYYAPTAEQYTKTVIDKQDTSSNVIPDDVSSEDEPVFSDDEKEREYRKQKAAAGKRPEDNQNRGQSRKRRVQFSDSPCAENGGGRGVHRGRGSGRGSSWNWHSERGGRGSSRGQGSSRGRGRGMGTAPTQTSETNRSNPYAEYGCFGPSPFVDTRQL
ncbi:H/ACA ribonucleoprotein complex subunit [Trichostrongylus colubriformis]|uniref:H/ACA ribonucleoprotein complex non-core subunit NAF1 n=1 Tax=Trichostrongylus colubriformis TaxID=6319 RepID=A0AAN8G5Y5_TRICO